MLPKTGKKLHEGARVDGPGLDFRSLIAAALKTDLGSTHQAIKTVMRWTGASERTVKHWFAGTHGPSGKHLVPLVRHSSEVLRVFLLAADRGPVIVGLKMVELRSKLVETVEHIDGQL